MANDPIIVNCQKCGAEVGHLVPMDGLEWLKVNGILVRSIHGVCTGCGTEFHWSTSDRILERLIKRKAERDEQQDSGN